MDRKDELILQQLETIRTMAENSLSRMGTDFWGTPKKVTPAVPKEEEKKEEKNVPVRTQGEEKPEEEQKEPEKIEDLKADSANIMVMIMDLEDQFGITVEDDQIMKMKTVGDVVNYIASVKG